MSKKVKIVVDAAAYEYSSKKWAEITGIDPSKVTLRLSKGEGLPNKEDANIVALIDQLLIAIEDFKPMTLLNGNEGAFYRGQIALWHRRLLSVKKGIKKQCKPLYLADVVNDILKNSKSKLHCSNFILTRCLHILGEQNLTPNNIASTIMDYGSTDWEKIPVPLNYIKKSLAIHRQKEPVQQETEPEERNTGKRKQITLTKQVEGMFMFPYSCKRSTGNDELKDKILNDLSVVKEYINWANKCGQYKLTDEYKAMFNSFSSRLQTLPQANTQKDDVQDREIQPTITQISSPFRVALEKQQRLEVLSKNDQLAMLKEGLCPRCGTKVEKATNPNGAPYLRCNACRYYAGLKDGLPYINKQYLNGVMPERHDS